jgi:Uncharacterized conserved protein (COG2071)
MADSRSVFLTAQWRHLAMLSFEVDPALVGALVPAGTGWTVIGAGHS